MCGVGVATCYINARISRMRGVTTVTQIASAIIIAIMLLYAARMVWLELHR